MSASSSSVTTVSAQTLLESAECARHRARGDCDDKQYETYARLWNMAMVMAEGHITSTGWHREAGAGSTDLEWKTNWREFVHACDFISFCLTNRRAIPCESYGRSDAWAKECFNWAGVSDNLFTTNNGSVKPDHAAFLMALQAFELLDKTGEGPAVPVYLLTSTDVARFRRNQWLFRDHKAAETRFRFIQLKEYERLDGSVRVIRKRKRQAL